MAVTSTGPWSKRWLDAKPKPYPSKNFHVKGKSSDWGPQAGFVPYDGIYSKVGADTTKNTAGKKSRVKAVVRPTTPGRSSAELQVDRMIINNDRAAVGVGVRAGDRGGGGVGVFVEWSSHE